MSTQPTTQPDKCPLCGAAWSYGFEGEIYQCLSRIDFESKPCLRAQLAAAKEELNERKMYLSMVEEDRDCARCDLAKRDSELSAANGSLAVLVEERTKFINFCNTLPSEGRPILVGPIQIARWHIASAKEDGARLDWLDGAAMSPNTGNGIALFPTQIRGGAKDYGRMDIMDLGDEDGSNLGETIGKGKTLRAAIDAARKGEK